MGDFAAPVAPANGSGVCIGGSGGPGSGGPAAASGSAAAAVPKHSAVVERLRQRIEGCRRHHVSCENRYQQAQAEQLERERRDTASLYQRSLEQRAKRPAGAGRQPGQGAHDADGGAAEQRSHTLIMLQETVKRKLEGARSPLNGDQQNGGCDGGFSPTGKRLRKDGPVGAEPSSLPLPQLDLKPALGLPGGGGGGGLLDELGTGTRLPDGKPPANGALDEGLRLPPAKEPKAEPLDEATCMDGSETSLSHQNKLFSDINLNDQEWQELIDELANTVPEDDIQDLFKEDFEDKKEPDFPQPPAEAPLSQEAVAGDPAHSPCAHGPLASPQARPASSGPPFPAPGLLVAPGGSPGQTPGQAAPRPGSGYLLSAAAPGPGSGPSPDLSPAEQLKQMAAQQQQRAKLLHKQHSNPTPSWSPLGPPSSPYGTTFPAEKPNSPMMYPQAFNSQNPAVPPMASSLQNTTMSNYLPQNPMSMVSQPPSSLGTNSLSKPHGVLTYGNTKPLTHFNADLSQRLTPPMVNPSKSPLMPYLQPQPQPSQPQSQPQPPQQLPASRAHLSEEQKRMLLLKQKGVMSQPLAYPALPPHGQEQHPMVLPRTSGPMPSPMAPGSGPGFLGSQPQALVSQMLLDQRAQLLEQQKQQFLREQRQQQQMLAEQLQQAHHPRQHLQQQRSQYPVQQVNQFQGSPQDMAAAVRSQAALQGLRTSRLMAQNAGLLGMGPAQSPGPSVAAPPEMGLAPYSGAPTNQPGVYSGGPSMAPVLQHPSPGVGLSHGQTPTPRQPASGQGSGFAQNLLAGSAGGQPHPQMKGPGGQALPRPQPSPRLPQGPPGWQQRALQGTPGRTSGDLGTFSNGAGYPLPAGQPRLGKQHFPPALGAMVDAGAVRTLSPAGLGRPMMPPQGPSQARPVVLSGLSQGVSGLPAYSQPPAQPPVAGSAFGPGGQTYERGPGQELAYGYGSEPPGGPFPGLPDSDLVDSIIKAGPGDEWMQELDELFGNP
ncbi:mastermind-like protein 3 isoform X2 [Erinaceus europaeus]|uniref:Mastermind-like protein 3 isoform X2 n=1 Tax=Erinaceus europaeus TaxID=9365 RepID=A0ABM3WEP4_ERIEU|nr:mastermind-like protein 3 isoform X2 [Erinaceus europaeus]